MQVNNTASNIPFKAPTEVDGQDRTQTRQQTSLQTDTTSSPSNRDTVSISAQARSLSSQETLNATSRQAAVEQTSRVSPGQTSQDVQQNPRDNQVNVQARPQETTSGQSQTLPVDSSTTRARAQDDTQTTQGTRDTTPPEPTARTSSLQAPAPAPQSLDPQNTDATRNASRQNPIAEVGGLSAGRINVDLFV